MEVCFSELYLEIAHIFPTVYKNVLIAVWILNTSAIQILIYIYLRAPDMQAHISFSAYFLHHLHFDMVEI